MKKTYLPALIVILVIGFAAVSTTLLINGTINFGFNEDEFVVKFTEAIIDDVNKSDEVITDNGKTLNFTTKELSMLDEESRLDFEVTNTSSQYDATVTMECTDDGEHKDYYTITKEMPSEIKAKKIEKGHVVVKLKKVITESVSDNIKCTLTVKAVEKTELAVEPTYINNTLLTKVNKSEVSSYETGNIHEMFKFEHDATDQTPELTEYRYIGNDPYNYISFNDESWRIIGMFDVNGEERLKIIRNSALEEKKTWGMSFAPNNDFLSGDLYSYLNEAYIETLSEDAQSEIAESTFYLGAIEAFDGIGASYAYSEERGIRSCMEGQYFDSCTDEDRDLFFKASVAIMYPSDYMSGYEFNDNCYNYGLCDGQENWLDENINDEEWLLSPDATSNRSAASVDHSEKKVSTYSWVTYENAVRPVVYLKDTVEFVDGSGTEEDPYIIQ